MRRLVARLVASVFSNAFGIKVLAFMLRSCNMARIDLEKIHDHLNSIMNVCESAQGIGSGSGVASSGEVEALERVRATLGDSAVVFDVGANVGDYATQILSVFSGKNIELHCFEPSAATFAMLSSASGLQGLSGKGVVLNNFALGARDERRMLYSDAEGSGMASLTQRRLDHFNINMESREAVEVRTLDLYAAERGITRIDFLKVDVEGHELDVFAGAHALLQAKAIRTIQFEFGGCNIDTRTYFQDFWYLFSSHGYSLYRIAPAGRLCPITAYGEHLERFTTTNFLASLCVL